MQFKSVSSPYLDYNKYQDYFTSTKAQFEDNSLNVPVVIGALQDESLLLIPTTPILKTTSKAGATITKEIINQADDIYLKAGIKTDNFLKAEVAPKVSDVYYNTANRFLTDPTKYTQGGIDFVKSYLPGVPTLSKAGGIGFGLGNKYSYEKLYQDIKSMVQNK